LGYLTSTNLVDGGLEVVVDVKGVAEHRGEVANCVTRAIVPEKYYHASFRLGDVDAYSCPSTEFLIDEALRIY
jgi:hypothetical protein